MSVRFSPLQRRLLTALVVLYTSAYFCRLNLSAALDGVMRALDLSISRGGLLQTVFALVYATGQLVNGAVVDRVNPAKYMLVGITGSAVCNLVMGMSSAYPMLLFIWAANAAFQSMLWTPVIRIIALHFGRDGTRERANAFISMALTFGHLGAWAISGFLAEMASWRFSFIAPGCIALLAMVLGASMLRCADNDQPQARSRQAPQNAGPIFGVFAGTGFFLVLAASTLYGFIRDGVVTWTPTLLSRSGSAAVSPTLFTLILPLLNSAGVIAGLALRRRGANAHSVVVMMMGSAILCGAVLLLSGSLLLTAVLLGLICAGMYGANTMLTGLIPLEYDCVGKTGLTAGLIDSLIYAGSALAGAVGGALYEHLGSYALYASWILAACASGMLMLLSGRMSERYWKRTQKQGA